MKRIMLFVVAFMMVFSTFVSGVSASSNYIRVFVEDTELSFATDPVVVNGTVCVPLKQIYELFNSEVIFDEQINTAVIMTPEGDQIIMQMGEPVAKVGKEIIPLKVAPYFLNNELFCPIDIVAESLNITATYDPVENYVKMERNPKTIKLTLSESVYFSTASNGAEIGTAVLNPTGLRLLYRSFSRSDYYAKVDVSSIETVSTANFYFHTNKFNNAANIAIYEISDKDYEVFSNATTEGISMKCEALPNGKFVASQTYAATSSVNAGFYPAPIDITEYVSKKVREGADTIYFRVTNISAGNPTMDNTRAVNFHTKAYVEVTLPPDELSFEGMKQYITNVYDYTPTTLRTSVSSNGLLYLSALNRPNSGKELNTFVTSDTFRTTNMYYQANIEKYEGELSNALLVLNARASVDGILNAYLVRDNKLSSGKIPSVDPEPFSTIRVSASAEYGQVRIDVRECMTQLDGRVAVKLEFVPDKVVNIMPWFYVYSVNSLNPPMVTIISKIEKQ